MRALTENRRTWHYPVSKPKGGSSFQPAQSKASSSCTTPQKKQISGWISALIAARPHRGWHYLRFLPQQKVSTEFLLKLPCRRGSDWCQMKAWARERTRNQREQKTQRAKINDSLGCCCCHFVSTSTKAAEKSQNVWQAEVNVVGSHGLNFGGRDVAAV